jgi:hypothetical protein
MNTAVWIPCLRIDIRNILPNMKEQLEQFDLEAEQCNEITWGRRREENRVQYVQDGLPVVSRVFCRSFKQSTAFQPEDRAYKRNTGRRNLRTRISYIGYVQLATYGSHVTHPLILCGLREYHSISQNVPTLSSPYNRRRILKKKFVKLPTKYLFFFTRQLTTKSIKSLTLNGHMRDRESLVNLSRWLLSTIDLENLI